MARAEPRRARRRRPGRGLRLSAQIHTAAYVAVNAGLVGVWALAGSGTFWPAWALVGWGIGLAIHWGVTLAVAGTGRSSGALEAVAADVARTRPDLGRLAAPDGSVTIVFSDIAGSTDLNRRLGDERWVELLGRHHALVRRAIARHGGVEVKEQGDGFMVAFAEPAAAVRCGLEASAAVDAELAGDAAAPVRIRVGAHVGTAIHRDDDLYGVDVAYAARVAAEARPGEVLVSEELGRRLAGAACGVPREADLKGLGTRTLRPVLALGEERARLR